MHMGLLLDKLMVVFILQHGIMFKYFVQSKYVLLLDNQGSLTLNMNVLEVNFLILDKMLQRFCYFLHIS